MDTASQHLAAISTTASLVRRSAVSAWRAFDARIPRWVSRNGVLAILDQGVVSGTSFLTGVIVGRLCLKEELGLYYLALTVFFFIRGVQGQLILGPYQVYRSRFRDRRAATYAGSSLIHQLAMAAATSLVVAGASGLLWRDEVSTSLAATLAVLSAVIPLLLLREFARHFIYAQFRVAAALLIDVTISAFQLAGLIVLGLTGGLSPATALLAMGAASAPAMIGWYFLKGQPVRFSSEHLWSDWWHNWRFGRWALAGQFLSFTMPYLLPWIVVFTEGESATGLLAAGAVLVGATNVFISGVANYLTPRAAAAFHESGAVALRNVLNKTVLMFLAALGSFALLTIPAGDALATLVFGAQYQGAGPLVAVLAFHALASALGMTAGNGLWALDRPAANLGADVCVAVVTVSAMLSLGGAYGVVGFASAMLFGRAVGVTVRFATLHRLLKQVGPTLHAPQ